MQKVLDLLASSNAKAKAAKAQDFFDTAIVKEIDDSGFIRSLY